METDLNKILVDKKTASKSMKDSSQKRKVSTQIKSDDLLTIKKGVLDEQRRLQSGVDTRVIDMKEMQQTLLSVQQESKQIQNQCKRLSLFGNKAKTFLDRELEGLASSDLLAKVKETIEGLDGLHDLKK